MKRKAKCTIGTSKKNIAINDTLINRREFILVGIHINLILIQMSHEITNYKDYDITYNSIS